MKKHTPEPNASSHLVDLLPCIPGNQHQVADISKNAILIKPSPQKRQDLLPPIPGIQYELKGTKDDASEVVTSLDKSPGTKL